MTGTQVDLTPSAVDSETFREALSLLASPLTIVTTRDQDGNLFGFTASSVTSVSLDPPLVLVGVSHTSSCFAAVSKSPEFVINVLGGEDHDLARQFATKGADRFAGVRHEDWPDSATPFLPDVAVAWRCETVNRIPVGDHDLLIGKLIGLRRPDDGASPLLWYQRGFRTSG
jgi:flavin reductase ActVB